MVKVKTSKKQSSSKSKLKKTVLSKFNTSDASFKNPSVIKEILIESLINNDIETFKDVLIAHLRAQPKSKLASSTNLGRQTLYDLVNEEKEFNPTLSTLSVILKSIAA